MPAKDKKGTPLAQKTGKKVDDIVVKLLLHGKDLNGEVRNEIFQSLDTIGQKQPVFVITQSVDFIRLQKPEPPHRTSILKFVASILESHTRGDSDDENKSKLLPDDIAKRIIEFITKEMIENKNGDVQNAATRVLVAMSFQHNDQVFQTVLARFQTGNLPNYYVMKTFADMARENPMQFVHRASDVWGKVIPVLGLVKKPPDLKIFTVGLGRFAEAILQFTEESDEKAQNSVNMGQFATNAASAFDIVFTNWRKQKDQTLRLAVAEAIGLLTEIMEPKRFASHFEEIVMFYLESIKKEGPSSYPPLAKGLCSTMKVMYRDELCDDTDDIEKLIDLVMNSIHGLAAIKPNYNDKRSLRMHSDVLKSFEYLARARLTQTLSWVLGRLQGKSTSQRLASLIVLKHFVNAIDDRLTGSKALILSSCQVLLNETDYKVRAAFITLIMGMADQGYLTMEGGQDMIDFLVSQCAITDAEVYKFDESQRRSSSKSKSAPSTDDTSPGAIRSGSDHILHVIASKVPSSHPVLWPYLFQLLLPVSNIEAVGSISRVLAFLARHKRTNNVADLAINWRKDVNLPTPGAIMARLFVCLNAPLLRARYGEYICACMEELGGILHEKLSDLWRENFPKLAKFLESEGSDAISSKFASMALKMFKISCDALKEDDAFITEIGDALMQQWGLYKSRPKLQKIVLIYLGQALMYSRHKVWLQKQCDAMLELADKKKLEHQEGAALGLGLCASEHLDVVLLRLAGTVKAAMEKKKTGLFGFGGKKSPPGSDETKSLIVRAWGWIALKTAPELITSRMDAHVFMHLIPIMSEAQKPPLKESVVIALQRIGNAMCDAHGKTDYIVKKKNVFIQGMLSYVATGSPRLRADALDCISTLLYLKPAFEVKDEIRNKVIDAALAHLNHKHSKRSQEEQKDSSRDKSEAGGSDLIESLQAITLALLETTPNVESLCQLIYKLEVWVVSNNVDERINALETYKLLCDKFISILRKGRLQNEKSLNNLGHYLATVLPRVTDSEQKVRQLALHVIQMLLFIDQLLRKPGDEKPSEALRSLHALKKEMGAELVYEARLSKIGHLAEILSQLASAQEFQTLLPVLIQGVNDSDPQAAMGVCKALQGLLLERASETRLYVDKLLNRHLEEIAARRPGNDAVLKEQLKSICFLARAHFEPVMAHLHKSELPLSQPVALVFKAMCADAKLREKVIDHELDVINNTPISAQKATKPVCIGVQALRELFTLDEVHSVLDQYYFQFLTTLIARLGTALCKEAPKVPKTGKDGKSSKSSKSSASKKSSGKSGKKGKDSDEKEDGNGGALDPSLRFMAHDTIECLKAFLTSAKEVLLLQQLTERDTWSKLGRAKNYELGVAELVGQFCFVRADAAQKKELFDHMVPFFKKHYLGHRNSATVVVAELIRHCGDDDKFLDTLVNELLPRVADKEARMRKQALIGLGNLHEAWCQELEPTAPAILSTLSSAMEDSASEVAREAILGLTNLLSVVAEETVHPSLINICFRAQPFFDSPIDILRERSYGLFAALARFGTGKHADNFEDQIHRNMATLVVHYNDVRDEVSFECKKAFETVAKHLKDETLLEVLQSCGTGKDSYITLLANLVPVLVENYPNQLQTYLQSCVTYMESKWGEIRGNSALLAAKIVQGVPDGKKQMVDHAPVVDEILKLLKIKSNPRLRQRTAKALSFLADV